MTGDVMRLTVMRAMVMRTTVADDGDGSRYGMIARKQKSVPDASPNTAAARDHHATRYRRMAHA
ncbi:hypothetical protein CH340_06870 [Rhodoplanes serenus]|nr:hypothetical protein CH340_06870 [Rhodoplanes serenus]